MEKGNLILRLVLGFTFFMHGLDKWRGGIDGTAGFFESVGIPGFMAYVVAGIELVGGILLMLGLGVRVLSILFAVILIGAIFTVKLSAGFLGGLELDIVLLAMSVHLALAGSSRYALDSRVKVKAAS
ncbi:DoxX family protein [Domibacillus sp. DTU_2020_1001157_1_SI_ALB_TIR_016]|uniref:DoxX family protein n=1 Tax=Domibacillus sp. DTU_2020_1001157_1_SI_ALB_TIR_016 TaxID=3077789 RepID=UPI0028F0F1C9|nr:DoxX family protein [Domibacillus sp. DTU_2020_1001157_1_SI_ALB_TIR_016]WNS81465.1 DoxX family protein [Domibacillus sp. DTU_2020_1001157_1_SI_ALB_TIR_016]